MLCYAILFNTMLCYAILYYAILYTLRPGRLGPEAALAEGRAVQGPAQSGAGPGRVCSNSNNGDSNNTRDSNNISSNSNNSNNGSSGKTRNDNSYLS